MYVYCFPEVRILTLDRTCFSLSLGESTTTQTMVPSTVTTTELSYHYSYGTAAEATFETPTATTTADTTTATFATTTTISAGPRTTTELTHDLTTGSTQCSGRVSAYFTSHSTIRQIQHIDSTTGSILYSFATTEPQGFLGIKETSDSDFQVNKDARLYILLPLSLLIIPVIAFVAIGLKRKH